MADASNNNWLPDIIAAIRSTGGQATLLQIYRWIERNRSNLPTEYQSVVRATIYAHSTDARAYVQGNPDVFYNVERGVWGLRHPKETIPGRSESALLAFVLSQMSREELGSFSGRGQEFRAEINRRIEDARRKYHMTQDA